MRPLLTAAVLLALAAGANADDDKYAADWMTYGAGARALGMGGAFVAVADDATAAYWNPAGLPSVERAAFSAMHSYTFNGLAAYDSIYGAYNLGKYGAVGGGLLMFTVDDMPITGWNDPESPNRRPVLKGYADSGDYAFYASYGRQVLSKLNVGANGVFIMGRHLGDFAEDANSSGQALDVAAKAGPFGPFTVGLNVQNIYSNLKWDTGKEEAIPMNVKVGGAYRRAVPSWDSEFTLAADCNVKFAGYDFASQLAAGDASFDFCGGGEWWYRRTVAVRLGTERSAFAGGVGLAVRALGASFGIDYAFLSDTGLESSHRASASVAF